MTWVSYPAGTRNASSATPDGVIPVNAADSTGFLAIPGRPGISGVAFVAASAFDVLKIKGAAIAAVATSPILNVSRRLIR